MMWSVKMAVGCIALESIRLWVGKMGCSASLCAYLRRLGVNFLNFCVLSYEFVKNKLSRDVLRLKTLAYHEKCWPKAIFPKRTYLAKTSNSGLWWELNKSKAGILRLVGAGTTTTTQTTNYREIDVDHGAKNLCPSSKKFFGAGWRQVVLGKHADNFLKTPLFGTYHIDRLVFQVLSVSAIKDQLKRFVIRSNDIEQTTDIRDRTELEFGQFPHRTVIIVSKSGKNFVQWRG